MILPRSTTLRASSIARFARPARYIRTAELQPWQRVLQRNGCRTYASGHGAHDTAKKSDLPWIATALAVTVSGVYLVTQQDLGHGEGHHDEHHDEKHEEAHEEEAPDEKEEPEAKEEESKPESKEDEPKEMSKGDDKRTEEKSPDKTDKPDPGKQSKSQNETSGKQEGLSNTDTKHTHDVSKEPEKSKKGEGVAESAKLKGTVSTDRPQAENKEERGKAQQDKSN
ncbi:hypothetical protein K469DRAFT_660088 [Zopfia rhizophila CBS 207.26]|uniref:Cylicin I n=1 Tax=Zopfia rhizophila CBS 207.26 TaxID=1314779 RepID=A0A6A6ECZ9_9PEZI|nr:hypothetical protein K469DRAFT_660088 [Zopfia rhizophila CBS 207.26]